MNLLEHLDIQIKQTSPEQVELALMVRDIHKQPFGIMHGGLNGVLIETACSLGANQNVKSNEYCVGVDLQVNHLRAVTSGELTIRAIPDKVGRTIQVWQATVYQKEQKIAVGRCTLMTQRAQTKD
ncbi:PaaI family thioesterase [Enterococcus cecorum]|uniref:PaaI family thioesterase n=1 Tax=Enterococcus cecorum TaxID=44008 RepID=A0AAW8TQB7_9ENTE|nr:PaaI family thioesterase [Enterococcus cecorum]MDT2797613.1 PaaI family thioesterase [Enterococcus cecorum]MDZ5440189.1 PaaI family thioesterase [Enterococcus cecorum]MDZ5498276.1 PaaI family thioesterase [Enterococcus cecorum]MDZ5500784.1 PaaI family thioesterase [Enterococcus cecorum]MDZ5562824.1 PaaI family thioesterase [Enterococcus cecorum]